MCAFSQSSCAFTSPYVAHFRKSKQDGVLDMLLGLRPTVHAIGRVPPPCACCFSASRRQLYKSARSFSRQPPRCRQSSRAALASGFFADVSTGSHTAQHLSEVLSNKPLIQHALQSTCSIVTWFALAFFVTRLFARLAKECETPEVRDEIKLICGTS